MGKKDKSQSPAASAAEAANPTPAAAVETPAATAALLAAAVPAPTGLAPLPRLRIKTLSDARVVERLKVLDKFCFPVSYSASYYNQLVPGGVPAHDLSQIALYDDMLVGSVTSRLQAALPDGVLRNSPDAAATAPSEARVCYIMTLAVLKPYRHLGIGTRLLQTVLDNAAKSDQVDTVALHVNVGFTKEIDFYMTKFGFVKACEVPEYYGELEEKRAFYLTLSVQRSAPATKGGKSGKK